MVLKPLHTVFAVFSTQYHLFSTPLNFSLGPPNFSLLSTYPILPRSEPERVLYSAVTYTGTLSGCINVLCNRPIKAHPPTHPACIPTTRPSTHYVTHTPPAPPAPPAAGPATPPPTRPHPAHNLSSPPGPTGLPFHHLNPHGPLRASSRHGRGIRGVSTA